MFSVRLATDDDFRNFFLEDPPDIWTALCGERDGEVLGIGGVVYSEDGVAVAFLDAKEYPALTMHRAAKRFFAAMRAVGEPCILTSCDESIPRATDWLMRLGFKLLPDRSEGQDVWRWTPASTGIKG